MVPLTDIPDPGARVRYSARPFPPYRFVPGVHPHPTRDPHGHSFDPKPTLDRHPPWDPAEWRTLDDWLYGVDLFNAHYFWEAHEAWEGLWAAVPRDSVAGLLVQGLIQIAAALLKLHMGSEAGFVVLSTEGLDKLRHVAQQAPRFMGIEIAVVVDEFAAYLAKDSLTLAEAPVLQFSNGA